ncbi:cytochrome c biogenesis CcdA family protein [Patescibacteria group bacterium]|nr:cytochrome c biogenesis CcdA family protein [Patescibacteria group bacterium]
MKNKILLLKQLFIVFFITICSFTVASAAIAKDFSKIYLFYGTGCSHCAQVEDFFEEQDLLNRYPVEKSEIYFNRDNAIVFSKLLSERGVPIEAQGVPAVVIGNKVLIGDKPIIDNFISEADKWLQETSGQLENGKEGKSQDHKLDLTLITVVGASIADAINPCAFAVLIILMTAILATGDGKKALKAGLAFASSIFISYFFMGLGLYKALEIGGISGLFYTIVGWLALILGLLNLKDYFWYGKGFLMEVPMMWRPKLKSIIKSATSPLGAFGVGFLVSLILLPCTSGPYIVILGMLAERTLQTKAILYLILYNLIFIFPMILISLAVYKGLNPAKAEEIRQKRLKTLHLIAGILMLAMGVIILNGWV